MFHKYMNLIIKNNMKIKTKMNYIVNLWFLTLKMLLLRRKNPLHHTQIYYIVNIINVMKFYQIKMQQSN